LADISVDFLGFKLRSPILLASSGVGEKVDRMRVADAYGAGGVVMKSLFEDVPPRTSPTPRFKVFERGPKGPNQARTFYSYEQSTAWDIDRYAEEVGRAKEAFPKMMIIPSLNCLTDEGWANYARKVEAAGADAIEMNLSCPHGSIIFRGGENVEEKMFNAARIVRAEVKIPVMGKISPMVTSPMQVALGAQEAGLDSVTIFNRATGLEMDLETERPVMHGGYAGHGGPWAIQYPLRWISQLFPELKIPISGSGGVWSPEDLVSYFLAGAHVVQFCSAIYFQGFSIIRDLNRGLDKWMDEKGYLDIEEFRGRICGRIIDSDHVYREHHLVAGISRKGLPPCEASCPAKLPVQGYLHLCAEGKERKALDLIREITPLVGVLGRVCDHPCESACIRGEIDQPLGICAIKRYLADDEVARLDGEFELTPFTDVVPGSRQQVAVIGAGPAGITCAWRLALRGYKVIVYEKEKNPGGMLYWAIPKYRLPSRILDREIKMLKSLGVEIKCNEEVTIKSVKADGAKAVVVAIGAGGDLGLGLKKEDKLSTPALEFLREANSNRRPKLKGRVVVVGGGNVAMDAARTALRCGASEVTILYRREREQMPAIAEEIVEAEEEGVKFEFLAAPTKVLGTKTLTGLECLRMKLEQPDDSGRPRPVPIDGSEFKIECDYFIPAIGQLVVPGVISEDKLAFNSRGLIEVELEEGTLATSVTGVFAAGDAVVGPASVATAVGHGVAVAESVELFLEGQDVLEARQPELLKTLTAREILKGDEFPTCRVPDLPDKKPKKLGFSEIRQGYDARRARAESARCLQCGECSGCGECRSRCLYFAIDRKGSALVVDREKCDGCGICAELCPQGKISMLETGGKP
jgi:dihydroorotate dehydrogenase subfamily 1